MPPKRSDPTIANISIMKMQSKTTFFNLGSVSMIALMRTGIPGIRLSARSGRNARTARATEKLGPRSTSVRQNIGHAESVSQK